jgi:hypothetical protein
MAGLTIIAAPSSGTGAPSQSTDFKVEIDENIGDGTLIGIVRINSALNYNWNTSGGVTSNADGRYILERHTDLQGDYLAIKVAPGMGTTANFDKEATNWSHAINIVGTDPSSGAIVDNGSFTIDMRNVNETPTSLTLQSWNGETTTPSAQQKVEHSATGTLIANLQATDADSATSDLRFTFKNAKADSNGLVSADEAFKIESYISLGQTRYRVVVNDPAKYDYDSLPANAKYFEHTLVVTDTAGAATGLSKEQTFRFVPLNNSSDDDAAPVPVVQFSTVTPNVSQNEGNSGATTFTYTVTRDSGMGSSTVNWSVAGTGANPAASTDFQATTGSVSFADGETSKTFTVNVIGDTALEANETFAVSLSAGTNATLGANTSGTGTILNDDAQPNNAPVITVVAAAGKGEAGTGADAGKFVILENEGAGVVVDVNASDADGDTLNYALVNTHGGVFSIDANGQISITDPAALDLTADADYTLTVRVSDNKGGLVDHPVYIRVKNVNQNPTAPILILDGEAVEGPGGILLSEKVGSGAVVGTLSATDSDGGTITFEIDPQHDAGGLFTVEGNKIKVTNANLLPVNADTPYTIKVIVRDGQGGSSTRDYTIIVQDKDVINTPPKAPTLDNGTVLTVAENTAFAGTLRAADSESTGGMTFEFDTTHVGGGDAGDMFVIDGNQLKLAPGKVLDYEAIAGAKAYTVYVRAKDGSGAYGETQALTINVADVDEDPPPVNKAPTDITFSGVTSFAEMPLNGTVLATLGATDPDDASGFVYSIVNGADRFQIVGNQLQVANGSLFNFEAQSAHTVTVRVTDKNGLSHDEAFTFGLTDGVDIWTGSNGNNTLRGTAGPDKLYGLKGKDKLYGGTGDDVISGGEGNDTLYGQKGKNAFVFDAKLGTSKTDRKVNFDAIKDFVVKDDTLWFDDKYFKASALKKLGKKASEASPKQLTKKFFTIGEEAKDKDDFFIYNKKTGVLSYDADGSGSKAAIEIAQLKKNLKMTYKDFFII